MTTDDTPTLPADSDNWPTMLGNATRSLAVGARVFGRFRLEALAGRGGMGVVWKAFDERLARTVALKFLPEAVSADPDAVKDLVRETNRCLELTHSNIVRVHTMEQDGPLAAIAMEYVDGDSLAKIKTSAPTGTLEAEDLWPMVQQLCKALEYAHSEAEIAHRDLKPSNILLTKDGQLKVTDFGIARSLSDTRTRLTGRQGNNSGTLLFMSPQQLVGDDPSSADDIYSLGATLYDLLTGKPPFYTGDVTLQIRETLPRSVNACRAALRLPLVPDAWASTIERCLAKTREERPKTAADVAINMGEPPPSTKPRFVVVIATGEEGTLELLYTHVIKRALPNAAVQIVRAKTTSLSELLRLPELGVAGLLVVLINNLDDKEGPKDWMERRLEFLRQIRDKTNAELIVLSGVWGRGYEERFRTAGADRAERLPIRNEILEQSAREAFQWWPARILQNRGPYRGQVFARR